MKMEYETIKSWVIDFGSNKFLEVSRKRALPDEDEFINISKGYYSDGEKRYQGGIGFPADPELINKISETIQKTK